MGDQVLFDNEFYLDHVKLQEKSSKLCQDDSLNIGTEKSSSQSQVVNIDKSGLHRK